MAASDEQQEAARGPATALGLGERLRSARKARALSVRQVADELRLEEPGILALEEGRFDDMGAPVFVRGHLRRYAQLVGLPPDAVLDAYRAAAPTSDAPPALARRAPSEGMRLPGWVFGAVGVLVVAGALLAIVTGGRDEAPAVDTPAAAPAAEAAPGAPAVPAPAELEPGLARLVLDFSQDSWVEIDDAERRVLYGLQTGGTRQEIVVRTPVKVMLGNARGVALTLDGAPVTLPPAAVTNNVARLELPLPPPPPAAAPPGEAGTGAVTGAASGPAAAPATAADAAVAAPAGTSAGATGDAAQATAAGGAPR